ncbi:MAG TPA: hypothetical protein DIU18_00130 [Gemmatimonadetes bacterium]|nr:hypothetical protein [Gemmatimonadota bacterium]
MVTLATLEKPEPIVTRPNSYLQIDKHDIGWPSLNDPERRLNVLTEAVIRRLATLVEGTNRLVTAGHVLTIIMGTGFPPFRGGLLRFADALTPTSVAANLEKLADVGGPLFDPAYLAIELAAERCTLYEAFSG